MEDVVEGAGIYILSHVVNSMTVVYYIPMQSLWLLLMADSTPLSLRLLMSALNKV